MPRSGRLRSFIREYKESAKFEKISFVPPFLILLVESILLAHAITIDVPDIMVVELTIVLLIISIIEIIFVSGEMHQHYKESNFDKILTIKLDDFIIESKQINVKKIVEEFIEKHPAYSSNRNKVYHTACQILETHKEEKIEEALANKLKLFISKNKRKNVDQVLDGFIAKYPNYKKYRIEIYEKTCEIMGSKTKKSK